MVRDLGLPVPPGFAISTEACRAYLAGGWPDGLDDEIRAGMAAIETIGRRFGDAAIRCWSAFVRVRRCRCPG